MLSDAIVRLEGVSKQLGKKYAVRDLSFRLSKGKIYGLVGPNGSGKSTLLKLLSGLTRPSKGKIFIDETLVKRRYNECVSYITDQDHMYPFFTVREMVQFCQGVYPDFDRERAEQMLSFLELDPAEKVRNLSKGTAGRLKMILALSRRSSLILMDEPLSGLDPMVRKSILSSLLHFVDLETQTVLICTHEVSELEPLLDMALLMNSGVLAKMSTIDRIQEEHANGLLGWMENVR